jgi:sensor domain CHASE-containing protein
MPLSSVVNLIKRNIFLIVIAIIVNIVEVVKIEKTNGTMLGNNFIQKFKEKTIYPIV